MAGWGLVASLCVLGLVLVVSAESENLYDLLGLSSDASAKDIRKAFKKLAIKHHPDKNKDDPSAHEQFLKINRAYEVLKDEEKRKRYDMHGEEGLKDDFKSGRHYESWHFYQNDFGIYDDDPEVITLSNTDFEQSVAGTNDVWFINFYSPRCSHCHDLAPTWREVAKQLEGVIRIGAINCEDAWQLCQRLGVFSFPTLLVFPRREKYRGARTTEALVSHVLSFVETRCLPLDNASFQEVAASTAEPRPWLITFCGQGGDCLESIACDKLSIMLEDLVWVGMVDCRMQRAWCQELGHSYGTFFYMTSQAVGSKDAVEITSLDAQEVASLVLRQLPDVTMLTREELQMLLGKDEGRSKAPWLVHFVDGLEGAQLELRKLPAMLDHIQVGRINCQEMRSECNNFFIHKFPTFVLVKETGGYEHYYGRITAHDVAAFARDSVETPLEALSPSDFPDRVVHSRDRWFVDFFAPWCPPCMQLLPEFKKAAREAGGKARFGTVDCTIHQQLCRSYNIHSYPTTILYNMTVPHQFVGQHKAWALVEFIEDTMHPPVISLNWDNFEELVQRRPRGQVWLVDFFAPWCGPCQQMASEWRRLAKLVKKSEHADKLRVGQVDCPANARLCNSVGVTSYPSVLLFPTSRKRGLFHMYQSWRRDAESFYAWALEFVPSIITSLHGEDFISKVLDSREPWLVYFYLPWCPPCQQFAPVFQEVVLVGGPVFQ